MAEIITDFKSYIERLVKKVHLQQMTPDIKARFDTYAKNKDFIGNMKNWEKDLGADIELDDAAYESAYKAFLAVFESMAEHTKDLNKNVKEQVFDKLFGTGKVFNHPEPINNDVKNQLDDFVSNVLTDDNETYLTKAIEENPYLLRNFDDNQFDYKTFCKGIKDEKYKTDPKFRKQLIAVVKYIISYPTEIFPAGSVAAQYKFDKFGLPQNPDNWFVAHYNPGFRAIMPNLVKQLTVNAKFRDEFKKYDFAGTISAKVDKGLEKTAYDDPKSDDFISPVYQDQKTPWQKVDDSLNKFKDNNLDSWGRILTMRGTRRFFSPYSKNIIESLAKVKTKDGKPLAPTDGIKGIIDNKDAVLAKITEASPTAKKHFEWFVGKMDTYSKKMPKAFNGALRNSKQMRAIVSRMIVDAIQSGKADDIEAAKTSMEILSTMKYGVFTSRTVDALKKEDFTMVSDKGLSWNKYEPVRLVTTAIDKTAKYAMLGVGRGVAAILQNSQFNLRTKFNGNTKSIDKAHKQWKQTHSTEDIDAQIKNYDTEIARQDTEINNKSAQLNTNQAALDTARNDLTNFENLHGGQAALNTEILDKQNRVNKLMNDLRAWVNLVNVPDDFEPGTPEFEDYLQNNSPDDFIQYNDLKNQLTQNMNDLNTLQKPFDAVRKAEKDFDAANNELNRAKNAKNSMEAQKSALENERQAMDNGNQDKYLELMAFWDMLESHWKSHQLTFASDKMRKKFLEGYKDGKSKAQQISAEYLASYMSKYKQAA